MTLKNSWVASYNAAKNVRTFFKKARGCFCGDIWRPTTSTLSVSLKVIPEVGFPLTMIVPTSTHVPSLLCFHASQGTLLRS